MKKSKFTLIEMLVVIAIILILAGILLPALMRAKKFAKMGACQSQMKQIAVALFAYAGDKKDAIPPKDTWKAQISEKYLGVDTSITKYWAHGVYVCPSRSPNITDQGGIGYNNTFETYQKLSLSDMPGATLLLADALDYNDVDKGAYALEPTSNKVGGLANISRRHFDRLNVAWLDGRVTNEIPTKMFYGNSNPKAANDYYYSFKK